MKALLKKLHIHIHPDVCCGFGNCATVCPAVFVVDDETNRVKRLDASTEAHSELIIRAAEECPTGAIVLQGASTE